MYHTVHSAQFTLHNSAWSNVNHLQQHHSIVTKEEEKVTFTKAEQVRKSKERIEKAKQITVEELTIGLVKYRELGLDFVKSENSGALMFQFTKIDHQNADRVFEFTLKITDEEDLYLVEDCLPELDDRVVMRLVDELNRTEDYPFFMRGMRRAFQDACTGTCSLEQNHEQS